LRWISFRRSFLFLSVRRLALFPSITWITFCLSKTVRADLGRQTHTIAHRRSTNTNGTPSITTLCRRCHCGSHRSRPSPSGCAVRREARGPHHWDMSGGGEMGGHTRPRSCPRVRGQSEALDSLTPLSVGDLGGARYSLMLWPQKMGMTRNGSNQQVGKSIAPKPLNSLAAGIQPGSARATVCFAN
jgi:hypothetical protein